PIVDIRQHNIYVLQYVLQIHDRNYLSLLILNYDFVLQSILLYYGVKSNKSAKTDTEWSWK
ncbi:MAG: hypothetical protein RSD23_09840, partial [Ruthenibacterium sp.]